jgi:methylaspartate ammonia-lyase
MDNNIQFLGIVKDGRLHIFVPRTESAEAVRLTEDSMVVGREIVEMDICKYEGMAIAVKGYGGGDWVYSAEIIDQAGPIVAVLLAKVFGQEDLLK